MADLPDMSHLTPEERRIIEGVMMRQKQEEERENEIMRRKQDEVQVLEDTIRARSEKHKQAGIELDATCHICMKTKFADGVGHICNYCDIRCCARCGGKVTLRSNKVIWVCILCRKKQELLSKTGQWMVKTGLGAADTAMLRRMQEDMQCGPADLSQDKRPKLERAHSAAEKENLPLLQRSGSALRRQYSQQEQTQTRRMSTSDSGVEMSVSPHSRSLPTPHVVVGGYPQQTPRHPGAFPEDDPSLYRGELDGLMKQHAQTYQRSRQTYQEKNSDISMPYTHPGVDTSRVNSSQHSVHQNQSGHQTQQPPGSVPGSIHQQRSFSSSEEERSTPECPSDEQDESEKGKGFYHHGDGSATMSGRHGSHNGHHITGPLTIDFNGHHPPREPRKEESTLVRRSFRRSADEWRADSRRFTERRGKKTVRFDGGTNVGGSEDDWSWEADRQGSQDSATKDSGIDTSSTFTSSEDSNRGDLPKQPGQKTIGHMILRKQAGSTGSSNILGLKVVGGMLLEDGRTGALIEKVKKGSIADRDGQLRPGDEVIEWNSHCLQGKSFQEVADIITESREEPQVELIVARNTSGSTNTPMISGVPTTLTPMTSRGITSQNQWRQKHEPMPIPQPPHHKELYDVRRDKPSVLVTSPGSPDLHAHGRNRHSQNSTNNTNVNGKLQIKLSYDPVGFQLIVTIICAAELTPRNNSQLRSPYARMYLLPDTSEKTKRRTKTLHNTNDPKWNETFIYNVRKSELKYKSLEITVWDNVQMSRYGTNDFLGEVIVELTYLNEKPQWYFLSPHDERRHIGQYQEPSDDIVITPVDYHLSPPSTTSRLSDSDTSEYDITDCDVSREQRRTADGASISSIGSSSSHYSSPPPERDLCMDNEHRSRRDMSPQGRKRAALMISRDQPVSMSSYQPYRKEEPVRGMMGHRSHSAAPMDSPNLRYRGRSQSPTGHRSLSPPEHRSIPYSHGYVPSRFASRSATATPTGSPKKRQLPQIPAKLHAALKERVAQDHEERARLMKYRSRQLHTTYRSTGMGGWEKHYSGLSDSDLLSIGQNPQSMPHSHRMHRPRRGGHLSPDKDVLGDFGDSDMESIASVASSAFSTQSERPRGSRALIPTVKNILLSSVISSLSPTSKRNRRKQKFRVPCSECYGKLSSSSCSTKTHRNPMKYYKKNTNQNPYCQPLVRSKSAVVRSMHKKMRIPLTRSQTLDDNIMRYYSSPDTSEFSTIDDYTSYHLNNIPKIHIQNITSSLDRKSFKKKAKYHYNNDDDNYDHDIIYEPRAKSFDCYDVHCDIDIPRRARSVEYDAISNIFSDDSLRTARQKVKNNLSNSGEDLPTMNDHSKSYYDSSNCQNDNNILNLNNNYHDNNCFYNYKNLIEMKDEQAKNLEQHLYNLLENNHNYYGSNDGGGNGGDTLNQCQCLYNILDGKYDNIDNKQIKNNNIDVDDDNNYRKKLNRDSFRRRRAKSSDSYLEEISDYNSNRNNNCERSSSYSDHIEIHDNNYFSENSKRRRHTTDSQSQLVNFGKKKKSSLTVPSFYESKRMMIERAESTPMLVPDEQDIENSWEYARRMSRRRRRNSSCPEARDIKNIDEAESSTNFFMVSDEDFGSVETVVCQNYTNNNSSIINTDINENNKSSYNDDNINYQYKTDRSCSYPCTSTCYNDDHEFKNRKTSCPECYDLSYNNNRSINSDKKKKIVDYQCGKRNVAISDTLEYYEYSMDSESQCSDNCGFGLYDTSRPCNKAPHPGKANSNVFDSQTAISNTAKNPRTNVHNDTTTPTMTTTTTTSSSTSSTTTTTTCKRDKNDNADNMDNHAGTIDAKQRSESSDYASPGGSYEKNTRHPVTGSNHNGLQKRGQFSRSLSNADVPPDEKTADGSLSDTAVGLHVEEANRRVRKNSPGSKSGSSSGGGSGVQYQAGLGKKSNSTSQLSATDCGVVGGGADTRTTGLTSRKRNSTPSSFQRSQEVVPTYQRLGASSKAGSVASDTAGSLNSISSSEASSWSPCMRTTAEGGQLSEFIDGLGPGQLVGRQVLGASSLGDIQLSLKHTKKHLEVEVVRARDLQAKPGSKVLPAPWVKVYLVNGKKCIAKAKTTTARKTLEPFYQQPLSFREDYHGCILQVVVWGDYGRLEARKVFMGVAQIMLDDLNLSEIVFGWYKLFGTTSL